MSDTIHIQLMDSFTVFVNERKTEHIVGKSRKGAALIQYLLVNRGKAVPNRTLLNMLWAEENGANPENALKTLVSRLRVTLNSVSPDLGKCIIAEHGTHRWELSDGMTVDLYQIDEIFEELENTKERPDRQRVLYEKLLTLYKGDLLQNSDVGEWVNGPGLRLHGRYLEAVYAYINLLKQDHDFDEIAGVCRVALDIDSFDDRLHIELMNALINTNRTIDALNQYKRATELNFRYLGTQPSEELRSFYKQIVCAGKSMELNMESICEELQESGSGRGAFICEYAVFREIYNLQMRNLERLGSTMFLGVIMVGSEDGGSLDAMRQDNVMSGLLDILRDNLRKGDTVTQFSPTMYAMLLPTVNYATGTVVMERIKKVFYRKFPSSNICFQYRVSPLGEDPKPL